MAGKLTASQARAIARDELFVKELEARLRKAKAKRTETRERYKARVPHGQPVVVGGYVIERIKKTSGPSFRIAAYLAEHALTKAMRPFMGGNTPYDEWRVREVDGG